MKRARIASLPAAAADLLDGERRAIVEWPSTPDGKPVAGCVISATRASDGTPMLDVMDCDPAMRVRVVWDNLARMAISDAALDRALAVMGYRPAYPSEHERAVKRKEMRAAIEVAVYGEPQGLSASRTLAAAGEIVDNALARETPPCAAAPEPEYVTYVCTCSWVGGDPDTFRKVPTCPACWGQHARTRQAPVAKSTVEDVNATRGALKAVMAYRGSYVHQRREGAGRYAIYTGVFGGRSPARRLADGLTGAIADACVAAFAGRRALREWRPK